VANLNNYENSQQIKTAFISKLRADLVSNPLFLRFYSQI